MKASFKYKIFRHLSVSNKNEIIHGKLAARLHPTADLVSSFPMSILYHKGLCAHMCGHPAIIPSSAHTPSLKQHSLATAWAQGI